MKTCKHKHCAGISFCEKEIDCLVSEWAKLFKGLKSSIDDDYRCSDDSEDSLPGFQVTIGFTPSSEERDCSWHYQTGDNSYSGGAYFHKHWAIVDLHRRSNSRELAKDCADQIAESVCCASIHEHPALA